MRVLSINPEFPVTYWGYDYALEFVGNDKKCAFPPLGLLTVASLLPSSWEKRLIDLNVVSEITPADIEWADMVFVTGMLIQKDAIHRVVSQCKAYGKRVVVGGPYVSTSTQEVPEADVIFVGEAEKTMPVFLKDLAAGTTRRFYVADKQDLPSLSLCPIPDFELVDMSPYMTMSVQYSRGCPYKCEFCDIIVIYGNKTRVKSNEQFLAELDALLKSGRRGSVFFADDNIIGSLRDVRQLMPELIKWQERNGYPFSFFTQASVNLADYPDLLEDMRRAGFVKVFLGIESPVEESLIETHKYQNTKGSLLEKVRVIQQYLEVMAGFIVGFDSDPLDIFQRQIDFIEESAIPLAMVVVLAALPDTPLWHRLKREGRLIEESDGNNSAKGALLNFVPKMDAQLLIDGQRFILETIYRSRAYYQRVLKNLSRIPPPLRSRPAMKFSFARFRRSLASFGRIVLKLGVIDADRREFWRFMYTTLREHRDKFVRAMILAGMGYHFRKLSVQ